MNNISSLSSINYTLSTTAHFLKSNPYARTTSLVVANIAIYVLTCFVMNFIEEKLEKHQFSFDAVFSEIVTFPLISTLAIKALLQLPITYKTTVAISLSTSALILGLLIKKDEI